MDLPSSGAIACNYPGFYANQRPARRGESEPYVVITISQCFTHSAYSARVLLDDID